MPIQQKSKGLGVGLIVLTYFALKPLYLTESGMMQISDILLIACLGVLLLRARGTVSFERGSYELLLFFLVLVIFQGVVNFTFGIFTGDKVMPRHTLYYVFNLIAFGFTIWIGEQIGLYRLKLSLAYGCFASLCVTAVGLLVVNNIGTRSTGFFNNPNQLGYFSVIAITTLGLCWNEYPKLLRYAVAGLALWAMIVSLSKAAFVAFFAEMVVLLFFINRRRTARGFALQAIVLLFVVTALFLLLFSENTVLLQVPLFQELRNRMLNMMTENDSSLAEGRGYARVLEMLPNIIWGTGEGAYDRFVVRHDTEVHSTFISILTCYGVIGLVGYLAIFRRCMGRMGTFFRNLLLCSGLLLYSLTHNGIRNTLLWILMAVMFLQTREGSKPAGSGLRENRTLPQKQ